MSEFYVVVATNRPIVRASVNDMRTRDDSVVVTDLPLDSHVVALASDALAAASVAVVDASPDPSEALAVCAQVRAVQPTLPIGAAFCCAQSATPSYVRALLGVGAGGFWDFNLSTAEMLRVLRAVARGQGVFRLQLATGSSASLAELFAPETAAETLSDTDSELLKLVALGLSDHEIGRQMYLSPHTIKHRIERVRRRLHIRNRIQLAAWAGREEALRSESEDAGAMGVTPIRSGDVRPR